MQRAYHENIIWGPTEPNKPLGLNQNNNNLRPQQKMASLEQRREKPHLVNMNIRSTLTIWFKPRPIISKEAFPFGYSSRNIIKLNKKIRPFLLKNDRKINNDQLAQTISKDIIYNIYLFYTNW
jgi:hypothetical protein